MKITYQETSKQRLDKFLLTLNKGITRSQLKKIILQGQYLVNGKVSSVHHWLKAGDIIETVKTKVLTKESKILAPKIVAEEGDYIIINKPSGLLVHPTEKNETNTLADWLIKNYPQIKNVGDDPRRPGIVHRLDKEASGLMVVALNQDFFLHIKKQFQDRLVKKEYNILVHGHMLNTEGEIKSPLERDKKTGLIKTSSDQDLGQEAHTTYQVIEKFQHFSLLRVQIMTGRTHQIRAHFFSIGHSVVGDKLYQTKDIRKKKKTLDQRIFLHSTRLQFNNLAGESVEYKSPLPLELKKFLASLK